MARGFFFFFCRGLFCFEGESLYVALATLELAA